MPRKSALSRLLGHMLVGPLLKLTKRARKADHVTQRSGQVAGKLGEDDAMTPAPSTLWGFSDGHLPAAASTYGGILSIIYTQGDPRLTSLPVRFIRLYAVCLLVLRSSVSEVLKPPRKYYAVVWDCLNSPWHFVRKAESTAHIAYILIWHLTTS